MKRRGLIIHGIVLLFAFKMQAQSSLYTKEQKNTYLDADSYFVYGDYLTAVKLFETILMADEKNPAINYRMGYAYYQLKKLDKAKGHLNFGVKDNSDGYFLLAAIHLNQEEFDLAIEALNQFEINYNKKLSNIPLSQKAVMEDKIAFAQEQMAHPELVNIYNLGAEVNTPNDEYVPLIDSDESLLIFTSRRKQEGEELDATGRPDEDIYFSKSTSENQWQKAALLPGEVNSAKNEAGVGLSPAGERLFIFRTHENLIGGDIYESNFNGNTWSEPLILDQNINLVETIEAGASISLDGKTLYFSSNRPGGYGGFDLYRVNLLPNGVWSEAKNLGPAINTAFNEEAPFIHPDGKTLFFSSQGHKNMGGYDVFKSVKEEENWSAAENLGYPTNSTKDDLHFVISSNEHHGYYSTEKEDGFGNQDLYRIDYLEKSLRNSVVRANVNSSGKIVEADISIVEIETGELVGVYRSNMNTGNFIFLVDPNVNYEMLIEADGYDEFLLEYNYTNEDLLKIEPLNVELKPLNP